MKLNTFSAIFFLPLVVFCGGQTLAHDQASDNSRAECSRIDKRRPPLFITFEHVESKEVLLRLHNNSRCSVLVPTNQLGPPSGRAVRQPNGGYKIEATDELIDGSRVPVVYRLLNLRGSRNIVEHTDGCVIMQWQLLPLRSILFSVPFEDLRKHADVSVEFNYPWEDDGGSAVGGAFGHYVVLQSWSLPQGIVR